MARVRRGFVKQTCWIADVKERHGLTRGPPPNRKGAQRAKPCPDSKVAVVEAALEHFGLLPGKAGADASGA